MTEKKKTNFLARRLKSCDGHLGRSGAEMKRIAKATGLSIHMVQSLAMDRRDWTQAHKDSIRKAIASA